MRATMYLDTERFLFFSCCLSSIVVALNTTSTKTSTTTIVTTSTTTTSPTTSTPPGPTAGAPYDKVGCPVSISYLGHKVVPYLDKCYQYVMRRSSWIQANAFCKGNGGRMIRITRADIDKEIMTQIEGLTSVTQIWIGANDRKSLGNWKWTDGSTLQYQKWSPGHPNNAWPFTNADQCVYMSKSNVLVWSWVDGPCSHIGYNFPWICEYQRGPYTPAPPHLITTPGPKNEEFHLNVISLVIGICGGLLAVVAIVGAIFGYRRISRQRLGIDHQRLMNTDKDDSSSVYRDTVTADTSDHIDQA